MVKKKKLKCFLLILPVLSRWISTAICASAASILVFKSVHFFFIKKNKKGDQLKYIGV